MSLKLNGQSVCYEKNMTVQELLEREQVKWNLLIVNGFFGTVNQMIQETDDIYAIMKDSCPEEDVFFNVAAARHTPGVQEKLKQTTVAIAGVGGLGSNIAVMLSRCGIGRLKIFDFDIVDPTNLNRQNYYIRHIGMKKVDALKQILAEINPYITVETYDVFLNEDNIKAYMSDADIVVEAFDKAEYKGILVNEILTQFDSKPIFSGSGMAGYGKSNDIQTKKIGQRLFICGDMVSEAMPFQGLMAPRVSMVAAHQSNAILRWILGESEV